MNQQTTEITGAQIAQTAEWVLIIKPSLPICEGGGWIEEVGAPEPALALRMRWGASYNDDTQILLAEGWRTLGTSVRFVGE